MEPSTDPEWRRASPSARAAYYRVCRELVLIAFDKQMAEGLDKDGDAFFPLRRKTIKYRRSAMGPADPHAPPLIPAHGLSRTRSLVDARVEGASIRVFWRFDSHTGAPWGKVLDYHRRGAGHLPIRDVFGLAPSEMAAVKREGLTWWTAYVAGKVVRSPMRAPGKPAKPVAAAPKPAPKAGAKPAIRVDSAHHVEYNGHVYTMSSGSAAELRAAIKAGTFRGGTRTTAEERAAIKARFEARIRRPPPPTPPPAPAPAPAPKPPAAPSMGFTRHSFGEAKVASVKYPAPAKELAKSVFGRPIEGKRIAALAGAPAGSKVEISPGSPAGTIDVAIRHPSLDGPMQRSIRREGGKVIVHNDIFKLKLEHQGTSEGLKIFAAQAEAAQKEGVSHFETNAFRIKGETYIDKDGKVREKWAGYYVWPSYGYDGPLKPHQKRALDAAADLPARVRAFTKIRQLMEDPIGKAWWLKEGGPIDVEFDLQPGSYSMDKLDKYLMDKLK